MFLPRGAPGGSRDQPYRRRQCLCRHTYHSTTTPPATDLVDLEISHTFGIVPNYEGVVAAEVIRLGNDFWVQGLCHACVCVVCFVVIRSVCAVCVRSLS